MKAGQEIRVFMLQIWLDILFFLYTCMTLYQMYKTCVNFIGQNPFKYMSRLTWGGRSLSFLDFLLLLIRRGCKEWFLRNRWSLRGFNCAHQA